jgi:hypothetical protein
MKPSEVLGNALNAYYKGYTKAKLIVHNPDIEPAEQLTSHYFKGFSEIPELLIQDQNFQNLAWLCF